MDTQKAVELIEKSENVGIGLRPDPGLDEIASAEVLASILQKKEKRVGLLSALKELPGQGSNFQIASLPPLLKEYAVVLNSSLNPVSQLRYEKIGDELQIILSPKSSSLSPEAFSFREGKTRCDLAILIGVEDPDLLNGGLNPEFFTETGLINLDVSENNKLYGEANLVDPQKSAVTEVVYELVTKLESSPPTKDQATLMLAGILQKTNKLGKIGISPDTFLTVSELMRLGADYQKALAAAGGEMPLGLLQLVGRASVRTRLDKDRGVLWSFVTAEDFEKTGRGPRDLGKILEHVSQNFPPHRLSCLLWQEPGSQKVRSTLAGEKELVNSVFEIAGGEFQSPYLLLAAEFASFREAEEEVSALLERVV